MGARGLVPPSLREGRSPGAGGDTGHGRVGEWGVLFGVRMLLRWILFRQRILQFKSRSFPYISQLIVAFPQSMCCSFPCQGDLGMTGIARFGNLMQYEPHLSDCG